MIFKIKPISALTHSLNTPPHDEVLHCSCNSRMFCATRNVHTAYKNVLYITCARAGTVEVSIAGCVAHGMAVWTNPLRLRGDTINRFFLAGVRHACHT